jgi:hypothetical protein
MLCLLAALLLGPTPQGAPAPENAPAARQARAMRFYSLEGALEPEGLRAALREVQGELVAGPLETACRPGKGFVAVDVPLSVEPKEIERALRKARVRIEPLRWSAFEGGDEDPPRIPDFGLGFSTLDAILGMAGELRWHACTGGRARFWYTAGKIDAESIADRYAKLYQPFGGASLGNVARQGLLLELDVEPEAAAARKLEAKVKKLDGVVEARIDARRLAVTVALDGLELSLPESPDGDPRKVPLGAFHPGPLFELCEREGVIRPAAAPEGG